MTHRGIVVEVLTMLATSPVNKQTTHVKSNLKDISDLILRSMDITETLDTIRGVHMDVDSVRLAESLNFFRSTPNSILTACGDFRLKALFFFTGGGRCGTGGG